MKKNKKIGIITFHNSYNCGSMLQAYALQTYLTQKGYTTEIIDFSNEGQKNVYSVFDKRRNIKGILRNLIILFYKNKIKNNYNSYEEFKNKNFKLSTKKFLKNTELIDEEYDYVITGSDQVWNITIEDGDDAYFLPWVKSAKKIAYAPSFGARNIIKYSNNPQKYEKYLKQFNCLSVRENNGKKWIKNLTGIEVPVLIDPTLLLEAEEYEGIREKEINIPSDYIFYYSPSYKRNINKLVKEISRKYKMPVIAFNNKNFVTKGMMFSGFKLMEKENPAVYLSLIKNAKLVITTSFHGAIFSTIYRKKFWVIKNGGMLEDDDRVLTLANNLDLEDRIIDIKFNEQFDYLSEKEYKSYENNLKKMQKQAKEYIEESLK